MLRQVASVQILSVDEMGEGIKPIRPQSLVDMMKVTASLCPNHPLFALHAALQLLCRVHSLHAWVCGLLSGDCTRHILAANV